MLLTRRKRENIAGLPLCIMRLADDAARKLAHHGARRGHKAEVRPAEGRIEAERLPFTDGNVRAALARCFQDGQRNGVHAHDIFGSGCVCDLAEQFRILQLAEEIRLLDIEAGGVRAEHGAQRVRVCFAVLHWDNNQLRPGAEAVGLHNAEDVRVDCCGDIGLGTFTVAAHGDSFCSGSPAVINASVGHVHTGQFAEHSLVFKNSL